MYSAICMMFDKLNAVYYIVSQAQQNTIIEIKKFDNLKDALFYYEEHKENIKLPSFSLLKRLGVLNVRD